MFGNDILQLSDKDILKRIENDWGYSTNFYDSRFTQMERTWKNYKNRDTIPRVSKTSGKTRQSAGGLSDAAKSHLSLPWLRILIDSALSTYMATIFVEPHWLKGKSDNMAITNDQLKMAENYMRSRCANLPNQMNIKEKWRRFIRYGLLFPWTAATTGWLREAGLVRDALREIKEEVTEIEKSPKSWKLLLEAAKEKVAKLVTDNYDDLNKGFSLVKDLIDKPDVEVLHPLNCRPDPDGKADSTTWRFFANYGRLSFGEMQRRIVAGSGENTCEYCNYRNLDGIAKLIKEGEADIETNYDKFKHSADNDAATDVGNFSNREKKDRILDTDRVLLITYRTPNALIVCDHKFENVVRKQRTTSFNVVAWRFSADSDAIHGDSLAVLLEPLMGQINHLAQKRQDDLNANVNRREIFNRKMLPHTKRDSVIQIQSGVPFGVEGDGREFLHTVPAMDMTSNLAYEIMEIVNVAQRLAAISHASQGVHRAAGERTALENYLVSAGHQARIMDIVEGPQEALETVLNESAELDQLYVNRLRVMQHSGEARDYFVTMTRQELLKFAPAIYYQVVGSQVATDRFQLVAVLQNIAKLAIQIPEMAQDLSFREVLKFMLGLLGESDRFLKSTVDNQFTRPIEDEHRMMADGHRITPGFMDDDEDHIAAHEQLMYDVEISPEKFKKDNEYYFPPQHIPLVIAHVDAHNKQRQQKLTPGGMAPGATPEKLSSPENAAEMFLSPEAQGQGTPSEQSSTIVNPNASVPAS